MARRAAAAVVLLSLLIVPLSATTRAAGARNAPLRLDSAPLRLEHSQPATAHPWCGTSTEEREQVRALASWVERTPQAKMAVTDAVRRSGNVLVLPPEPAMVPFDHRADLANRSVSFERTSATTYRARSTALQYEEDIGTLRKTFEAAEPNESLSHTLQRFTFPFGSTNVSTIHISERFGLFLAPPSASTGRQLWPVDTATIREAVIAPYLQAETPRTLRAARVDVYVRETDDRIVVTWRSRYGPDKVFDPLNDARLDLQAVIERSGNITFSYREIHNLSWGAVALTNGQAQPMASIAAVNDPVGDVNATRPGANLIDIRRVEVFRTGGSELLSVRVKLGGSIRPPSGVSSVNVNATFRAGGTAVGSFTLTSSTSSWRYCTSGNICRTSGSAAEFGADEVTLHLLDRHLAQAGNLTLTVSTSATGGAADSATLPVNITRGTDVNADLSAAGSGTLLDLPLLETFTLPVLNVQAVWDRLRDDLALWDEEIDGVAIFQNFETDIMQFATAYSTVGNSGADGVWAQSEGYYGSSVRREPALLHMNRIVPGDAGEWRLRFRQFLTAHELGHRWLYGFTIRENGGTSWVLNPGGGHPAQYVHTPAAFQFLTSTDYSVMGGSTFRELSATSFATPSEVGSWGYSWHELYLMGLAAPSEVADWYYVADSNPRLGDAYHPPVNFTVSGRRVNVSLSQIVESMGPRFPVMEKSQRAFRLLFVLLQEPGANGAAEEELLRETAETFPQYFSTITGGRGTIITTLPETPLARIQAPSRGYTGVTVAFRDDSAELPTQWQWDFGDGSVSAEQHPEHAYANPGRYTVTLRVTNSRGSSTATQEIEVERAARRRPAP
jgi:hypothetical protein